MNPSFNGTSITNGTRLPFDVSTSISSQGLLHFPNPNILKQGYTGYNIGNLISSTIPYPRCHTTMRKSRHFVPNECKDEYYWHKRLKNNEAARKSRQKRRTIDSVLEDKVMILIHENQVLRQELYAMKVKYGEISAPSDHQEPSSSTNDNLLECGKLKKGAGNIALTNKLISQALAKSDEKRIGLRQSLLETINLSLSKENEGKHNLLPHRMHTADADIYNKTTSTNTTSAPKFPNELLSNLASGTYVLTSISPGSEDMAGLPSNINGCGKATVKINPSSIGEQSIVIPCRIPTSSSSNPIPSVESSFSSHASSDCSADEKAMEAANTLANLLKRSSSTQSSSSHERSNSPKSQHFQSSLNHQPFPQQSIKLSPSTFNHPVNTHQYNTNQNTTTHQYQNGCYGNGTNSQSSSSTSPDLSSSSSNSPTSSQNSKPPLKKSLPHKLRFKENKKA